MLLDQSHLYLNCLEILFSLFKHHPHRQDFNPFQLQSGELISGKSIENFHPNWRTFLKKGSKKDGNDNPFSIQSGELTKEKRIMF